MTKVRFTLPGLAAAARNAVLARALSWRGVSRAMWDGDTLEVWW